MEISLRLDTLGMVELRYLRGRERYRDWPQFQLLAASRQAQVLAYLNRDVAEQLHQQILVVEEAVGLDFEEDEDETEEEQDTIQSDAREREETGKTSEREGSNFSPALAQALKQLNELARQRLPDVSSSQASGELRSESSDDDDDVLEQLQEAFAQMMDVVRELAEEMATDALKITGRFKCARTEIGFIPRAAAEEEEDEESEEPVIGMAAAEEGLIDIEVELVMVLKLYEEGRARADDPPAIELQLDVDDFERLHETLDVALERERRSHRRHHRT